MSELERKLRDARDAFPEPDGGATERARQGVLAASARSRTARQQSSRLVPLAGLGLAALVVGAFFVGFAVAPGGAKGRITVDGPGFLPARGWSLFQTGAAAPPRVPTAVAANIPLSRDVADPYALSVYDIKALEHLGGNDVFVVATFRPVAESPASFRARYPRRELPFTVSEAKTSRYLRFRNSIGYKLRAAVNGYDVDLVVFLGGRHPSAVARANADAELARLVVPEARPVLVPATQPAACRATQLKSQIGLQGATGTLLGGVGVRNVSRSTCTLTGRPRVTLTDSNGEPIRSKESSDRNFPTWRYMGAPRPRGWPEVRVAPGHTARAGIQLENWCRPLNAKVFFHVNVPGGGTLTKPFRVGVACYRPNAPVGLGVGPWEPRTP